MRSFSNFTNSKRVCSHSWALLKANYRYWYIPREVEAQNRRNRAFEEENDARNLLLTHYRKPAEGEKGKNLTVSDIVLRFGGAIRLNKSQLSTALKELGFSQVRTHNGRFWQVVERTAEEMAQLLPEPVEEIIPGREVAPGTDGDDGADAGKASSPFPSQDEVPF